METKNCAKKSMIKRNEQKKKHKMGGRKKNENVNKTKKMKSN